MEETRIILLSSGIVIKEISLIIKQRFPNLTVGETIDLSHQICQKIYTEEFIKAITRR